MVVLRSTTPCVAVSSLSRSNLLTVISIAVPCAVPVVSAAIIVFGKVALPSPWDDPAWRSIDRLALDP